MSIESKLDQALKNSPILEIDDSFKGFFASDLHRGVGDEADDFKPNASLFFKILQLSEDYQIFVLGDGDELWENSDIKAIRKTYPEISNRLAQGAIEIEGNHNQGFGLPPSYILLNKKTGKKILLVHGHQGDFFCDEGYPLGKFFIKYIWRNLQMIGFKDPTTAVKDKNPQKHEVTRIAFHDWAWSRKQTVIFGHTHFAESDPPYYWNCGSWVGNGGQAVVIEGDQITLKTFS